MRSGMKVKILVGFAKGVEGVAESAQTIGKREGWVVKVTYPEGFDWMGLTLAGVTEELFYYTEELELVTSE